jgi:O-antigen ligase
MIAPILFGILTLGIDFRRAKFFIWPAIIFCATVSMSLFRLSDVHALIYVFEIYYLFLSMVLLLSVNIAQGTFLRYFCCTSSIVIAISILYAIIDNDSAWGRFFGHTAPNYWGGLGLVAIVLSTVLPGWISRIAVIIPSIYVIYISQSRGEIVGLVASFSLMGLIAMQSHRTSRWALAAVCCVPLAGVIIFMNQDFILQHVFKISDSLRGVNSNFSGRLDGWREALQIFEDHPLFGVGFEQHGQYMSAKMVIHNGYLSVLADTGLFGLLGYVFFLFGSLFLAVARALREPVAENMAVAGCIFAFVVGTFFEPGGIHTGDTIGMLLIVVSAWSWRANVAVRRAPRAVRATIARPAVRLPISKA